MPLPQEKHYTYADYLTWESDEKYELFDGMPVMQARPSIQHQNIEGALLQQLRNFLDGKPCKVFAEIEVLLPDHAHQSADDVSTVYVPDIAVICEPEKLTEQYCFGAPTVIMEILSPSTAKADRLIKLNRYQQAGVSEYWIVSPQERNVTVFKLSDGAYHTVAVYTHEDAEARVLSLDACMLDLSKVL
ncbi:MAG: Uma2 family endonuclease [Agathobaculum sp.]|jgi:Uma2 family endonuclease|uniref:Uma2 family endonuclease n=1 Tax=Agathobaculum sp. TaxID=2048138 RepID=UPI003D911228